MSSATEALGIWGESSLYDVALARLMLGECSGRLGEPACARGHLRAVFSLALEHRYVFPEAFEQLADMCISTHPNESVVLLGAAAGVRSEAGTPPRKDERYLRMYRALLTELGREACDASWAEGCALSHAEAAEFALSLE